MNNALIAITQAEPQFAKIARTNNSVNWDAESQFAMQAIAKNNKLAECAPETIQDAVINVAAVGLTLNPADGYAYLVPEWNKPNRRNECQLRISFKGLIKAATQSGAIKWVKAELVYSGDTFTYCGPTEKPKHEIDAFGDRGDIVGVYCIAKTNDNDILCDIMSKTEIDQIKECAKTQSVWTNWYGEMAKKACIKRAQKQWPKTDNSTAFHTAIDLTNKTEGKEIELNHIEETASYILEKIKEEDYFAVGEAWAECSEKEQSVLWTAKTKGGFFTHDEEKTFIRKAIADYKKACAEEPQEGKSAVPETAD